jgi:competence protein ComEA
VAGELLDINAASYEELRTLRLSVTQTGRVLAHRERKGGFGSLDELDEIPGFPQAFLAELKSQLRV